jgi:hypothetical protein
MVAQHNDGNEEPTELLIEHFSRMYYFEMERKDKINSAAQLPISIVTLAMVGLGQYWQLLAKVETHAIKVVLGSLAVFTFLTFLMTVICTIKVFFGYTYDNFPHTTRIKEYLEEYGIYMKKRQSEDGSAPEASSVSPASVRDEFLSLILDLFTRATTTNTINNDMKTRFLVMARKWTVATIVLLLLFITVYHIPELVALFC